MVKKAILISIVILSQFLCVNGSSRDSLWTNATTAYTQERYSEALDYFNQIKDQGWVSAELFYNIGNCYFKEVNMLSSAILYYEKALKLDPSFRDAQANLDYARQFCIDRIDSVPDFILITWIDSVKNLFSSNMWAILSIICFISLMIFLLIFRFGRGVNIRKLSLVLSTIFLLFFILTLTFSITKKRDLVVERDAIVMIPVTSVKASPLESAKSVFILHEGTKVEIIEKLGNWSRIEISDGRQGWLDTRDIEII